jgi:hypothetical protein
MTSIIPGARRIEPDRLLSVLAIPLAAALAMAIAVTLIGTGPLGEGSDTTSFVLSFVKVSYLAVAMAHLAGALADRVNGALPAGIWFDDGDDDRPPASAEAFWSVFPNHADGAVLALAIAVLATSLG